MVFQALIKKEPIKFNMINFIAGFFISFFIGACEVKNKNLPDTSREDTKTFCGACWELEKGLTFLAKGDLETGVKYFLRDQSSDALQELPEFLGNKMGAYWDTQDVVYEDINHDDKKDIIILARYMTGIGPSGSEPFQVPGFYIKTADGFRQDVKLFNEANDENYGGQIWDIKKLVLFVKKKFQ